jgi:TonB family protein
MKLLLTLCLALCSLLSFSQAKENFYVLDSSWNQTVLDSAKYLFWIHQNEEGNWVQSYYHMWGPMIKMETFNDHDGVQRNGLACYYYANGKLDSVGHYRNGKKEGSFVKYRFRTDDSLEREKSYEYANDSLVSVSVDREGPAAGKIINGDKESEYPGGLTQWQQFLGKNLHYPDRAIGNEVKGEVKILFTVDEQGNVIEPMISKSVEYSLDRESLRLIRLSGKWEPGLKDGKTAKTDKIQPIRFVLTTE